VDSTPRLRRPYAAAMAAVLMRVAICAAVRLYREGLGLALGAVDTVDVVAIVASASEAGEKLVAAAPDIVLVDAAGPEGIEEVRRVVDALPDAKVVALAIPEDAETVLSCAEAGVSGFVTRESSLGEVVAMLESVSHDELLCSPEIAATLLRRVHAQATERGLEREPDRLTRREHEVLELIGEGLSNKEIATRLSIEVATVKNHVHSILAKLGVARRGQAAAVHVDPQRPRI